MNREVREGIAAALGSPITDASPLSGGDINEAYRLTLGDGRFVFAKVNARAEPRMFPAEARGLAWLAEAHAIALPKVLAVSDERTGPAFLVLEYLEPGTRKASFDETLGRGLAALHRSGANLRFGLDHDNFIGELPQPNDGRATWAEFYGAQRLLAQAQLALERGRLNRALMLRLERLVMRLPSLVGPAEPAARLHGDLWGGNVHVSSDGLPVLIDPAAYAGHREVDLAMMRLFGGFGARVFAAYQEEHPLSPGHAERVALYQLYPLLVHLNHFGQGYLSGVESAIGRYE